MICEECGTENKSTATNCSLCGTELGGNTQPVNNAVTPYMQHEPPATCPTCGEPVNSYDIVCQSCGEDFSRYFPNEAVSAPNTRKPQPKYAPSAQQPPPPQFVSNSQQLSQQQSPTQTASRKTIAANNRSRSNAAQHRQAKKTPKWSATIIVSAAAALVLIIAVTVLIPRISGTGSKENSASEDRVLYPDTSYDVSDLITTPFDDIYAIRGEVLIHASGGAPFQQIDDLVRANSGELIGYIESFGFYHASFPADTYADLVALADIFASDSAISSAMPELLLPILQFGSAGEVAESSGLATWGQRAIEMYDAHSLIRQFETTKVKVGVIDNWLDNSHADISVAKTEFTVRSAISGSTQDHGTHVTGIIGALHNNIGIRGVLTDGEIYFASSRVFSNISTLTESRTFASRMVYAFHWLTVRNGCKVISMSFSLSPESFEQIGQILGDTLTDVMNSSDVLLVCSAGNEGMRSDIGYTWVRLSNDFPVVRRNLINVGAIAYNSDDPNMPIYYVPEYSNFGPNVDIVAPGGDGRLNSDGETEYINGIYSTIPGNSYDYMSGTSMAAPFVTGVAGLIWELNPDLSAYQVKEIIIDSAIAGGAERGWENGRIYHTVGTGNRYGYPMLNARAAVEMTLRGMGTATSIDEPTVPMPEPTPTQPSPSLNIADLIIGDWRNGDQGKTEYETLSFSVSGQAVLSDNYDEYPLHLDYYIENNKAILYWANDGSNGVLIAAGEVRLFGEIEFAGDGNEFQITYPANSMFGGNNGSVERFYRYDPAIANVWKDLYTDVVRNGSMWGYGAGIAVHDIDRDGVPELIIRHRGGATATPITLYTIVDNSLTVLLDDGTSGDLFYNPSPGVLIMILHRLMYFYQDQLQIENGAVVSSSHRYWDADAGRDFQFQKEDGSWVSGERLRDELTGGISDSEIPLRYLTEEELKSWTFW